MMIEVGDKIRVHGELGFHHHGIYVGPRGPSGEDVVRNAKGGYVASVHFDDFADGREVEVAQRRAGSWEEQEAIVRRAFSLIGRQYDLINFNCEHFANYATAGVLRSETVTALFTLGLVGAALWATARRG